MPILVVETNQALENETTKAFLDKAIALTANLLDKPRDGIMARITPDACFQLGQTQTPAAFIELKVFAFDKDKVPAIINALTDFIQKELGVAPDRQFHEYIEMEPSLFGWNGAPC